MNERYIYKILRTVLVAIVVVTIIIVVAFLICWHFSGNENITWNIVVFLIALVLELGLFLFFTYKVFKNYIEQQANIPQTRMHYVSSAEPKAHINDSVDIISDYIVKKIQHNHNIKDRNNIYLKGIVYILVEKYSKSPNTNIDKFIDEFKKDKISKNLLNTLEEQDGFLDEFKKIYGQAITN